MSDTLDQPLTIRVDVTTPPDTEPPDTAIDTGPAGIVNSGSARFSFSSSEPNSTFECRLDGTPFSVCSSPKDYSALADGPHTFEVRAIDVEGNTDATPTSRTWTVDTTVPSIQPPRQGIVANSTLSTSTIPLELTWSGTDGGSGVVGYELQESINGGSYVNVSLPSPTATNITRLLEPASTYQYRVRAQDQAGNWSDWQAGPSFGVDAY
jgi:hypothetical protein